MKKYVLPVKDRFEILYFGDAHFHNSKAACSPEVTPEKYLELLDQLLYHFDSDIVICGGDFFHLPQYPRDFTVKVISKIVSALGRHTQLIWCLGNHDIFGYSNSSFNETIPGLLKITLEELAQSKSLVPTKPLLGIEESGISFSSKEYGNLDLFLFDSKTNLEAYKRFIGNYSSSTPFITCGHQRVGPEESYYCQGFKSLPYRNNQVISFWADIHEPFLERNDFGNPVINNGSICRRTISEEYPSHIYRIQVDLSATLPIESITRIDLNFNRGTLVFPKKKKDLKTEQISSSESLFTSEKDYRSLDFLKSLFNTRDYDPILEKIHNEMKSLES